MTEDPVDTELFIDEIRQHPEIWNVSSDDYKDKYKKISAWIEVCKNVYPGFEEKTEEEKNNIGRKLMNRWKNIRDNFQRSEKKQTKSRQGATGGRKYIYAKQLSFLQEANKTVETTSSLDENITVTEKVHPNVSLEVEEETTPQEPPKKRRRQNIEDALINFTSSSVPSKKDTCDELNEDRSYFESLLSLIKDFTADQKIGFRLEVLNIIRRIRNAPESPPNRMHLQQYPQIITQPYQFHTSTQSPHQPHTFTQSPHQPHTFTQSPHQPHTSTQSPYQPHIFINLSHPFHFPDQSLNQSHTSCHAQTFMATSTPSPLSDNSNHPPSTPNTDTSENMDLYSL